MNDNILINQSCDEWLESVQIKLKEPTYANYYNVINSQIKPYFNDFDGEVSNTAINEMIKHKFTGGRLDGSGGLSAKTVRDIVIILKQVINFMVKKDYINSFDYDIVLPKSQNADFEVLTPNEQTLLTSYIKSNFDAQKIGVFFALYAGLRIGEVCALKWENIDFHAETISVTKTLQRIKNTDENATTKTKIIIDEPKSDKSKRKIPLPPFLIDLLKPFEGVYSDKSFVLTGSTKQFIEPRLYEKIFKRYLVQAKINNTNFHTLRHTFATRAIEHGFDAKSLSEILGHSSVEFTLKKYVHSSMDLKKKSMERLSVCYAWAT